MPPASPSLRPLRAQFLERLMSSGTWCSRVELTAGMASSTLAIEDALADLVLDGLAEYRANVGYRLAGSVLQRRAAKLMRAQGASRGVYGQQVKDEYRVGVVEQVAGDGLGLVMYELALPMPAPGPDNLDQHMQQVQAVIDFSTRGTNDGSGLRN